MARIGIVWVIRVGVSDRSSKRAWLMAIARAMPSTMATAKLRKATLVDSHRPSSRSVRL
jgi:hypothetical protein